MLCAWRLLCLGTLLLCAGGALPGARGGLIAGGAMTAGVAAAVLEWTGFAWEGTMAAGLNGAVTALGVYGNRTLVASGEFTGDTFGTQALNRTAYWDGVAWQPMGVGLDAPAYALLEFQGLLYVGGVFYVTDGMPGVERIATWDGARWAALPATNVTNGYVLALAVHAGELYAGGDFAGIDGRSDSASPSLARWNGSRWSDVGEGIRRGVTTQGTVRSLVSYGGRLFIGGIFDHAGPSLVANNIAVWDADNGIFQTLGSGTNGEVRALAVFGTSIVVGGAFTGAGGFAANGIARWSPSGSAWSLFGTGLEPYVTCVIVTSGVVVAGGDFLTAAGGTVQAKRVAQWTGTAWTGVGAGFNDLPNAFINFVVPTEPIITPSPTAIPTTPVPTPTATIAPTGTTPPGDSTPTPTWTATSTPTSTPTPGAPAEPLLETWSVVAVSVACTLAFVGLVSATVFAVRSRRSRRVYASIN